MTTIKNLFEKIALRSQSSASNVKRKVLGVGKEQTYLEIKKKMRQHFRLNWKPNGVVHYTNIMQRLKGKQLTSLQISRLSLSKRSFEYPKNYHGLKNSIASKEFSNFSSKDKEGHLPFLQQGEKQRIEKVIQFLRGSHFKRTNTVKNQYFGFCKITYSASTGKCQKHN